MRCGLSLSNNLPSLETQLIDSKLQKEAPPFPKPENSRPLPRPTPGEISVSFALGSMDCSASALEILRKAADEMTQNEELFLSLQRSASGFGTSLGKGRAEAVKSKLAEMGVTAGRFSVSDQTQGNGDSVKVSFSNRLSS